MSRVADIFQKNLALKLVSLFLAILLEIFFYSPDNSTTTVIRARVDVVGLPPNYVVMEPRGMNGPFMASVHLRGPRTLIDQVKTSNARFRVAVAPGSSSPVSSLLDVTQLSLPSGVEALRISPERVTVKFDREVKKELLVVLDKTGRVPEGFRIESVSLFPSSVVVRGPLSMMEGLQAVETVALDIEGLRDPIDSEISLKDLGPQVSSSVTMVRARIEIAEVPNQKVFENVAVKVIAPKGFAASLEQPKASIVLAGPVNTLKRVDPGAINLRADANGLEGGLHELPLSADLPDGVKILSTEPSRVKVRLTAPRKGSENESPNSPDKPTKGEQPRSKES